MRLNKKRLAALAMSAVMAASAVPFPVYAEELSAGDAVVAEEATVEPIAEEVTEAPEVGATVGTVVTSTIKFYYNSDADYGVSFEWSNGVKEKWTQADTDAKKVTKETVAATCTQGEKIVLKATIGGTEYSEIVKTGTELAEHEYERKEKVTVEPTCDKTGTAVITWVCKHCNTVDDTRTETVTLDKVAHKFEGEVTYEVNADWNTEKDKNGKPVLKDATKDGYYNTVQHCSVCNKDIKTKVELKATEFSYARVIMKDAVNIKTNINTLINGSVVELDKLQKDSKTIELKDCTKDGSFVVKYYANKEAFDNKEAAVATETITVPAHHYNTSKAFVFKSDADKSKVTFKQDSKTGEWTLTNNSCYETIKYKEVSICQATGCKHDQYTLGTGEVAQNSLSGKAYDVTEKELQPAGNHQIATDVEEAINDLVKAGNVNFHKLSKAIGTNKYVKVEAPENVCEQGGVVKVNYLCVREENTVVKTQDVTLIPGPHKETTPAVENKVVATCANPGSYDLVTRCAYCNKELSKTTIKTARLKHTNESAVGTNKFDKDETTFVKFVGNKVVDNDGYLLNKDHWTLNVNNAIGSGITDNKIVPTLYTNCKECGAHEVKLSDKVATAKVVEIQKEDSKGQNGYIVVEVTYTRSNADGKTETVTTKSDKIPYYSSEQAYNGRVEDAVLNGLHKDDDGVYRYYVNGELQKDYTGMIEDNKEKYLVVEGVLATDMNGLWYSDVDKVWYFFVEGHVRSDYTGTALYDGEWFYVSNGKLDEGVSGLVPYNGGTFLFVEGRLRNDVSGLWQDINNPDDWYFLALGQVQTQYSGVAMYDGGFFVVENGKFDKDYNGTIKYDGKTFKVVGGQLVIK